MYAKLIFRDVRRSVKDYLVYVVTMTICVTLFYAFLSISSRYYHPDIGLEYDFTLLSDGMKLAICCITLLLLFLIRYVNSYLLKSKQKDFAIQCVMGMEQKTLSWLFFGETFLMSAVSVFTGIFLGVFCSQFITAMLLSSYGQKYTFSWMLFPDTVLLTVGFFALSFLAVGLFNVRTIRKFKIVDMLYADRQNEPHIKKSRYMTTVTVFFNLALAFMVMTGLKKIYFYFDSRFPIPLHIVFWGNVIVPALGLLLSVIRFIRRKKQNFSVYLIGQCLISILCAVFAASVATADRKYHLSLGIGALNQYLFYILIDIVFLICGIIYLAGTILTAWKEKSPEHKYRNQNLFFYGQVISKLQTTSKTMTVICLTLVLGIFLFIAAPALSGWSSGYLDVRSLYDVQIFSTYTQIYDEADLMQEDYGFVTDFLDEKEIHPLYDCTFRLYLPKQEEFHNRVKFQFPVVAISLSDYNALRKMLDMEEIRLKEDEFTTQWNTIATDEYRAGFLSEHKVISTDAGKLSLAENSFYNEPMGETIYNNYTDVIYIFPDAVCNKLLGVMKNRYIITETPVSFKDTAELEQKFYSIYPEESVDTNCDIRTRTQQINNTKASIFILNASMTYGAVVLMVICLTVLALQQLLDAEQYRYRFGVLRKLGVEEKEINQLVLKQLTIWFGLPVGTAILISLLVVFYFFQMISTQISAYVGFGALMTQVGMIIGILFLLLICYFLSTWILFKHSITEE